MKLLFETAADDRKIIRDSVGPFNYLGLTGGSEPIWNKRMRAFNCIDLVCFVFDQQYTWVISSWLGTSSPTSADGLQEEYMFSPM